MKPAMVQMWILDASPLILLHKIDFLKTISEFARTWLIPGVVVQEIEEKNSIDSYMRELSYKSQVKIIKKPCIIPSIAAWDLGPGECEVISNAVERKNAGVILDDLEARKCARWIRYSRGAKKYYKESWSPSCPYSIFIFGPEIMAPGNLMSRKFYKMLIIGNPQSTILHIPTRNKSCG